MAAAAELPLSLLSVLIPCFNEEGRIGHTLDRLLAWGERFAEFEVLIVDDGSGDRTAEVVRSAADERVRLAQRPQRGGKGAAVRTGMAEVRLPWVLVVDADLPLPLEQFSLFERESAANDVVLASKFAPRSDVDYPWLRRVLSRTAHVLIEAATSSGVSDTQCGFKLFRTEAARHLFACQRLDGYGYDFEVLFLARRFGYTVAEVPARIRNSPRGKVSFTSYAHTLGELAALVWNRALRRYPAAAEGDPPHLALRHGAQSRK